MNNKEIRNIGFQLAFGVWNFVSLLILLATLIVLAAKWLEIGLDDSDTDSYNRSGLEIHKDAKTGKEYLSTPSGGIIER